MTYADTLGNTCTGAGPDTIQQYERALHGLQCYTGDPVAIVEGAIAVDPGFVMGHVLHAYLHVFGTEPAGLAVARADLAAAGGTAITRREQGHLAALRHLASHQWHAAGRVLEDVAIEAPRDALALQAGHLIDFFTGSSRMLRDRIARARPAWSPGMPGYHALLAMHAFGLEESGAYDRAESLGRSAVELEPRDAWAQHAVAHVMEMQGRPREGIAWMRKNREQWADDNFFAVHNWWHLALFHLDLGEIDEVLALYDGPVDGHRSPLVLDLVDASALLWRLHLLHVDVGERWDAVAERWSSLGPSHYAFNDAHAVMAFVGAGRLGAARAVLDRQTDVAAQQGDNLHFLSIGAPVCRALVAFGAGDYAEVVRLLRPVRNLAQRFGGSHAQRDILDLTLIEAALRDGQHSLARAMCAERFELKPLSLSALALMRRAADGARGMTSAACEEVV